MAQTGMANVCFSIRALLSSSMFPVFVVITAWITLLYVVGLAGAAGCYQHWSDRTGVLSFATLAESVVGQKLPCLTVGRSVRFNTNSRL